MDLADAHMKALNYLREGNESNIFNLGTGEGFSVKEMIDAAEKATGLKIKVEYGQRRAGDPARLKLKKSLTGIQNIQAWKKLSKLLGNGIKLIQTDMKTNFGV